MPDHDPGVRGVVPAAIGDTCDMLRVLDFVTFPGARRARARGKLAYRMLQSIVMLQRAPTER